MQSRSVTAEGDIEPCPDRRSRREPDQGRNRHLSNVNPPHRATAPSFPPGAGRGVRPSAPGAPPPPLGEATGAPSC